MDSEMAMDPMPKRIAGIVCKFSEEKSIILLLFATHDRSTQSLLTLYVYSRATPAPVR
jgi:hypothetical protein